jgi:hypothetical protein
MDALIKWALNTIDHMGSVPVPFLIAFLILFVLIGPTVFRAFKAKPEMPIEVVPKVLLDAGGVYTILVNIELQLARLQGRLDIMEGMMRRRQKRPRKTQKAS